MNDARLRLYVDAQYTSPYALSAFVVLREKGLDFEWIPVDLEAGEQQGPQYTALSVTQRVPTLVHGDFSLSESSAIDEYLEEVFPGAPVYPRNPQRRAKAREVQAWLRSDLAPLRQERSTLVVFYGQHAPALTPVAKAAAQKLIEGAEALLPDGAGDLFGEWSIADVELALMLNRLILNGDDVPEALVRYAKRQWARPSVQEWVNIQRPAL
ncbi:glutathione transferase [Pseudomonas sp. SLFW]|uniref:glutathione transferase n=1 Tax=Pseudomonas sp. SLFW TaxID=2683259 RepID=UPI001411C948|nr:glutathione transferase [Pseudomonas sp. SLFW]